MDYTEWTDYEIEKLKYAYQLLPTWNDIYETFPGRNKNSIKGKALSLGLRRPNRIWKEKDVETLKRLYPTIPNIEDIFVELKNKTKSSIVTKAQRLKLSRPNNMWTEEEIEILKKIYPTCDYKEVREKFINRTPGTIRVKACSLGLKSKRTFKGGNLLDSFTEREMGYLAGIIDGEGTIGYRKYWVNGGRNFAYTAYISICNTNYKLMEWLTEKISKNDSYVRHGDNRKPTYNWRIQGRKSMQIMREIAPYLILKREIAIKVSGGHENHSNEERDALIEWVHKFNKRGVH